MTSTDPSRPPAGGAPPDRFDGEPAVVLRAPGGTEAVVLPGTGANCISFAVPVAGKGAVQALAGPPSAAALRAAPNGFGVPILWPHPGQHRLSLPWGGDTFHPAVALGRARLAGHGFASEAPWQVLDASHSAVTCRLETRSLPDVADRWRWPARLTVTHTLEPGALRLELVVENLSDQTAPLMAGLHPYFPLRFGEGAGPAPDAPGTNTPRETCALWAEADQLWELAGGAATGRVWDLDARLGEGPEEAPLDLRRPQTLASMEARAAARGERLSLQLYALREALQDATRRGDPAAAGGVTSGVWDRASGLALTLETGRGFGTVGVYCPAGQPFVSLEPRSSLPDAMALAAERPDLATGLRALAPGESWRTWARFTLAPRTG